MDTGRAGCDGGKRRRNGARRQYGAVGDAYVRSAGHAGGNDLARLVELAAPQSHKRVLDIATGGGHVAKAFAPHVAEVVASDLTPEMLATAEAFIRGLGIENVTFALADAENLPFADGSSGSRTTKRCSWRCGLRWTRSPS